MSKDPIVYVHGLPTYEKGERTDPPDPRQVEICKAWIKVWADPRRTINRRAHSYSLKHDVESQAGDYIPNGAFIKAALELGFQMEERPPNAVFNMSLARLRRHQRRMHRVPYSRCSEGCTPEMSGELRRALDALREADRDRTQLQGGAEYRGVLQAQPGDVLYTLEVLMHTGRELLDHPDAAAMGCKLLRLYALDFHSKPRDARIGALQKVSALEYIDRGLAFALEAAPIMLHHHAVGLLGYGIPRRHR